MNKSDLANHVAKRLHISHSDSLRYLNTLIEEVEAILAGNEYLTIQNFGTFSPWHQTARPGRNPKNGTIHEIPARTSVKFKPGKRMLEKLPAIPVGHGGMFRRRATGNRGMDSGRGQHRRHRADRGQPDGDESLGYRATSHR